VKWVVALLALAGCRTDVWDPPPVVDGAAGADLRGRDAVVGPDLREEGTVLFGANDARRPVGGCRLEGDRVGDYAFLAVPTGAGTVRRVDLFIADPASRAFELAVYDGADGVPGKVLARGTLRPAPERAWVGAVLDRPVPLGGVLWIGSVAPSRWTFLCPWSDGGFAIPTRIGGPGGWRPLGDRTWMFRLVGK
jgi:hypothetical protein